MDCCLASQPFGWPRTKSMLLPKDFHMSSPCRPRMYCFVDSYKYLRISLKISVTVLFGGRAGISSTLRPCSAARWDGRKCNLNLCRHVRGAVHFWRECKPFSHNKPVKPQQVRVCICVSFRADSNNISGFVITNDARNLGVATDLLLTGEPENLSKSCSIPTRIAAYWVTPWISGNSPGIKTT